MQPSSKALLWYFWRLSRVKIVLLVVLSAAAMAHFVMERGNQARPPYAYMDLCSQLCLVCGFGVLFLVQSRQRPFVPSSYLMTLSLSTGRYVAVLYGYVIIVIGVVSCAISAVHLRLFGNVIQFGLTEATLGFWQMPLLCVCLVCIMQSVIHLVGTRNELVMIPLVSALATIGFVSALPLLDPGNPEHTSLVRPALMGMILAWLCSWETVAAYRSQRWGSVVAALMSLSGRSCGRVRTFRTTGRALFWLGWRRHGRIFLVTALLGLFLMVAKIVAEETMIYWGTSLMPVRAAEYALFACLPMVLSGVILCFIVSAFRDSTDFLRTSGAYFLTLPIRSAAIARGRLFAMAFSLALALMFAVAGFAVLLRVVPPWLDVSSARIVFTFLAMAAAAWIGIWFGSVVVTVTITVELVVALFFPDQFLDDVLPTVAVTVALPLAVLILAASIYRGALDRTNAILMALVLPVALCLCAAFKPGIDEDTAVFYVAALLIPLPFAAAPLALDWVRRR